MSARRRLSPGQHFLYGKDSCWLHDAPLFAHPVSWLFKRKSPIGSYFDSLQICPTLFLFNICTPVVASDLILMSHAIIRGKPWSSGPHRDWEEQHETTEATESGLDLSCFLAFLMENIFRNKLKEERRKWQKEIKDTRILTFWVKENEREVINSILMQSRIQWLKVYFIFFQYAKKNPTETSWNPVVNAPHFKDRHRFNA